jgi:hypothetical protein
MLRPAECNVGRPVWQQAQKARVRSPGDGSCFFPFVLYFCPWFPLRGFDRALSRVRYPLWGVQAQSDFFNPSHHGVHKVSPLFWIPRLVLVLSEPCQAFQPRQLYWNQPIPSVFTTNFLQSYDISNIDLQKGRFYL